MKQQVKKYSLYLILGFVAFFTFRLAYGYLNQTATISLTESSMDSEDRAYKKNYASSKIKKEHASGASYIEQKFEKVGSFFSYTEDFDADNKKLRQTIAKNKAVVQYENNNGTNSNRSLYLSIGVNPELFDTMCEDIEHIGTITSKNISKTDKTNEFKNLNAKRSSLEKLRNSLIELKLKGGKIDEFITLENRILETEELLQDLGVSLGDFDEENEFCTVRFTLNEHITHRISFLHRTKVALEWSLKYYTLFVLLLFLIVGTCYLGVLSYMKLTSKP